MVILATHRRTTASRADRILPDCGRPSRCRRRIGARRRADSRGEQCLTTVAPRDSRANLLYADEQAPLTWREAWRLLVKSWPFVSRYRRLVAIKCALVFVSLTFFLMTPWPLKIVIDNVIDGHPLTGIPGAILTPMVGASRTAIARSPSRCFWC